MDCLSRPEAVSRVISVDATVVMPFCEKKNSAKIKVLP